ncbi:MAG: hypothetical protein HY257_03560 [Chloroflexi bacterium]|nr:hypothetical protein [Chloroflexota bacterium]
MNVLDENITPIERQRLREWHIAIRHIGYDIGRKGMDDEAIIPTEDWDYYAACVMRSIAWYLLMLDEMRLPCLPADFFDTTHLIQTPSEWVGSSELRGRTFQYGNAMQGQRYI